MDPQKQRIRILVRGYYDIQKLRIQSGNRIVANFKAKQGQEPSKPEKTMSPEELKILITLRNHYKRITDGIRDLPQPRSFKGDAVISDYAELVLTHHYTLLEQAETTQEKAIKQMLPDFDIYNEFLLKIDGCGTKMSGIIISEIEIEKAEYPSSLWKYTGLDVAPDGAGRSRRKEHLIDVEYTTKEGKKDTRKSISFNPLLKTKLVGVLGPSFMRQGPDHKYAKIYYDYKNRLEHHVKYKEVNKGHRHNMAIRYMMKMFLIDLYTAWRSLEGLPVARPYSEAKLGMKHKKAS